MCEVHEDTIRIFSLNRGMWLSRFMKIGNGKEFKMGKRRNFGS